jgi:hypothetical protein
MLYIFCIWASLHRTERDISWLVLGNKSIRYLPSLFVFYNKHNPDETSCVACVCPYSCWHPRIALPQPWPPSSTASGWDRVVGQERTEVSGMKGWMPRCRKQMEQLYEDRKSVYASGSKSGPWLSPTGQYPCSSQHANHNSYSVGMIRPANLKSWTLLRT